MWILRWLLVSVLALLFTSQFGPVPPPVRHVEQEIREFWGSTQNPASVSCQVDPDSIQVLSWQEITKEQSDAAIVFKALIEVRPDCGYGSQHVYQLYYNFWKDSSDHWRFQAQFYDLPSLTRAPASAGA